MAFTKYIVGALATLTLGGAAQAALIQIGDPNSEIFFGEDLKPIPAQTVVAGKDPAIARNNFLSKLESSVGSYGFEGDAPWPLDGAGGSPLAVQYNGLSGNGTGATAVTATLSGVGGVTTASGSGPGRFNTTTGGGSFLDVKAGISGASSFTINFTTAIAAFGFYGTDIGDYEGTLTAYLTPAVSGPEEAIVIRSGANPANNGALLFWGFASYDAAYTSIRFESTLTGSPTDPDYFGFDDFVVATRDQVKVRSNPGNPGVPEPGSVALVGLALLGAAAARRR